MAAKKKPAGIRSLVYGMGKGKGGIKGLSVSVGPDGLEPSTHGLKVQPSKFLSVPLSAICPTVRRALSLEVPGRTTRC